MLGHALPGRPCTQYHPASTARGPGLSAVRHCRRSGTVGGPARALRERHDWPSTVVGTATGAQPRRLAGGAGGQCRGWASTVVLAAAETQPRHWATQHAPAPPTRAGPAGRAGLTGPRTGATRRSRSRRDAPALPAPRTRTPGPPPESRYSLNNNSSRTFMTLRPRPGHKPAVGDSASRRLPPGRNKPAGSWHGSRCRATSWLAPRGGLAERADGSVRTSRRRALAFYLGNGQRVCPACRQAVTGPRGRRGPEGGS